MAQAFAAGFCSHDWLYDLLCFVGRSGANLWTKRHTRMRAASEAVERSGDKPQSRTGQHQSGFALTETIDFMSKKVDKCRRPIAAHDGVRQTGTLTPSQHKRYWNDSAHEGRDESGLKPEREMLSLLNHPVRMKAAMKAD
ncbi:MAG TPA: hypothetical protein VE821_10915 [Pyrinomonadaceae bacterium]|nr:hypothetical protein [Pyrinomonadaceae bacterium]